MLRTREEWFLLKVVGVRCPALMKIKALNTLRARIHQSSINQKEQPIKKNDQSALLKLFGGNGFVQDELDPRHFLKMVNKTTGLVLLTFPKTD